MFLTTWKVLELKSLENRNYESLKYLTDLKKLKNLISCTQVEKTSKN